MKRLERITMNPKVMGGKPCIRGMRVTVGMIVGEMGAGMTQDDLLFHFPYLEEADIHAALAYSAQLAQGYEVDIVSSLAMPGVS